jgi:replicative DNA helicase
MDYDSLLGDLTSAEYAIVGICMHDPRIVDEVDLSPGDFRNIHLGALYGLMGHLLSEGQPTDPASVCARLGTLQVGGAPLRGIGPSDVMRVYSDAPSAVMATAHARTIREVATRRRLIEAAGRVAEMARADGDVESIVETARAEIDASSRSIAREWSMADAFDTFAAQVGEEVTQFPTMWPGLNDCIGGYRPGALYTIGARPGIGKSIYGVQALLDLSDHGQVIMQSMEMSQKEVLTRITANVARINSRRLDGSGGQMRPEDWVMLEQHRQYLRQLPVDIDDRAGVTLAQVRSRVRNAVRKGKVSGLIIDHLGLVGGDYRSAYERVTEWTRALKILAKEFEIPVIVQAQLNRNVTARSSAIPILADLRESGSIEQDSDVVVFLFDSPEEGFGMHLAKNRQGPNGITVPLVRRGEFSRLENIEHRQSTIEEEA